MKIINLILIITCILSCKAQNSTSKSTNNLPKDTYLERFILENQNDSTPSISKGTVSNGQLENGKIVPYKGKNFRYFDSTSYVNSRGYLNHLVLQSIVETYKELEIKSPSEFFTVMECSNKNGGKIYPHRTHQNGLSVDFMTPLIKDGKPYYSLDSLGAQHYLLEFDNNGNYTEDKTISINFDLMALHILTLNQIALNNNLKISKVILKTELKDELFNSKYGKELAASGIYFAKQLTPIINQLHDDHYHIDFEITK
jgi:penicillin-insensitive murein endopeptidase